MKRNRRGTAVVVLALALALAGCGGKAQRTAPQDAHRRLVSVPWLLLAAEGRRLKILVDEDEGCNYVFDHTTVTQTPRRVRIAVYDRVSPLPRGVECATIAYAVRLTIRLQSLLGERVIVHAPITPGLPGVADRGA